MQKNIIGRLLFAALACSLLVASCIAAEEDKQLKAFLTPEEAGPDFQVQGEYLFGSENGERIGAQIIALGDGKFDIVAYPGGLPGTDEIHDGGIERGSGETIDGVTFFKDENLPGLATIKDGVLKLYRGDDLDSDIEATLKKVVRKSPTLGKKAPEGAVVLFDGTTAEHFEGGRMKDGMLLEGLTSKQKFGSYDIHLEFRTPFQPWGRGQKRGNSGYYSQGRYETQILDSFGLSGENNECGGIYGIKKPDVNMCFPPLSWQTYDIEYRQAKYDDEGKKIENARITVLHNGVKIHDNVELPRSTTAAPVKEGPAPGPVYLQNHNNPVRFRNIWLIEK